MLCTGNCAFQFIIPISLSHRGATKEYSTLRPDDYWPGMANDLFQTVRQYRTCVSTRGSCERHHKLLKLFLAPGPLEFVAVEILTPFKKMCQKAPVYSGHYRLVYRDLQSGSHEVTTTAAVAQDFLEKWDYAYEIPL